MKITTPSSLAEKSLRHVARHRVTHCVFALVAIWGSLNGVGIARGQDPVSEKDANGAEVLTRGPVHEAFAGIVSFNPEPGVIVEKVPPQAIEEMPPEERPTGDNTTWIPGYWAWDDERNDYLWISGTWRALPPGRSWITGYWSKVETGYQWISGYWADATAKETTYLPKPPPTVETGPNVEAPSRDYRWTPGSWVWHDERYAWRAGYWAEGRSDWDWMPAHYVWTPRGYVFVDGYWDYRIARRGVLFAPVYFEQDSYSRPGYSYSPIVAINLLAFIENAFLRPHYHHYYFGDYYDSRYENSGYYSPFRFQSNRYGYDPVYSQQRWQHRQDRNWAQNFATSYQYRRDHVAARPPRTWAAQHRMALDPQQTGSRIATSFDQMAKSKDSSLRFQKVPGKERQRLTERSQVIQKSREERRVLEAGTSDPTSLKTDEVITPTRVTQPKSPIVGKSASSMERKQAPPKAQRASAPSTKMQLKPQETGLQPSAPTTVPKNQQAPRNPGSANQQMKAPPRLDTTTPNAQLKQEEPQPKAKDYQAKPLRQPDVKKEQSNLERPAKEPQSTPSRKSYLPKEQPKPEIQEQLQRPSSKPAIQEQLQRPSLKPAIQEQLQRPLSKPEIQEQLQRPSSKPAIQEQLQRPSSKPVIQEQLQRPSLKPAIQEQLQRAQKNVESTKTRQTSPPIPIFTPKPQEEISKPRGKQTSSNEVEDEKNIDK